MAELFHSKYEPFRLSLHAADLVSVSFRVIDPRSKSDIAFLVSTLYVVRLWPLGLWGQTDHTPLAAGVYELWNLITFTSLEAGGAKEADSHHPAISTIIFSTCPWDNNNKKKHLDIEIRIWSKSLASDWTRSVALELSIHFEAMWKWILRSYRINSVSMRTQWLWRCYLHTQRDVADSWTFMLLSKASVDGGWFIPSAHCSQGTSPKLFEGEKGCQTEN